MFAKNLKFNTRWIKLHPTLTSQRCMSVLVKSLKYSQYGEPEEVLKIVEDKLSEPKEKQVLVKVLAAPINPSDTLTIQGKYAIKPKFPAIGGYECVAEVIDIGSKVTKLKVGERVVPFASKLNTWTTHALYEEQQLMPISKKIGLVDAATITVNPCTAYRMLKDFVELKAGDCVIQNGANSAVGHAVHQLCKAWHLKSVGIVRDRPEIEALKEYLKNSGATEILTEEEIRTSRIFKEGRLPKPRLALNCIGGKSATEVTRHLDNKGVMVIYGDMSFEPVTVSPAAVIFKDISIRGFWLTTWLRENQNQRAMFAELCDLMEQGKFLAPVHEMVPFEQFKEAVAAKGFTGKKYILNMQSA